MRTTSRTGWSRGVLELLETEETTRDAHAVTLLDGLKAALCSERISRDSALECLDRWVSQLSSTPGGSAPGPVVALSPDVA